MVSQVSDMGSIPIARSINPDGSIGFTLLTYPESDPKMDRCGLKLDRTEANWTELFCSALMFQIEEREA